MPYKIIDITNICVNVLLGVALILDDKMKGSFMPKKPKANACDTLIQMSKKDIRKLSRKRATAMLEKIQDALNNQPTPSERNLLETVASIFGGVNLPSGK